LFIKKIRFACILLKQVFLSEKGDSEAQNFLGEFLSGSNYVPMDNENAFEWYRTSAEQGNFVAKYNLGLSPQTKELKAPLKD
jgi:TPR repeat protein